MTAPFVERARSAGSVSGGPSWVATLRRRALDRFVAHGFPTTKNEEWRFTSVAPIERVPWRLEPAASVSLSRSDLDPFTFGQPDWPRIVFVNGRFASELSQLDSNLFGLRPLAQVLKEEPGLLEGRLAQYATAEATPFAALNTAFMQEGAVLTIPAGVEIAEPIHLVYVTTTDAAGLAVQPRNLIVVEAGARVQLVESYETLAPGTSYWTNTVTEVVIRGGAWVEHARIQRESEAAFHIGLTHIHQARDSHYRSFSLAMGGAIARHDLRTRLDAANVEALLYGLYLSHADQLIDTHTTIYHDHPNCRSWEVYKGVLEGHSHAVFNGKVLVTPEAQKTDAKQTNRNLILSDGARVDTKPQLEIFADDVKCTHGATVGRLDEVAYFYLQSRGIPRAEAQRILTYAFAAEVLAEVTSAPVREALERTVQERLWGPAGAGATAVAGVL